MSLSIYDVIVARHGGEACSHHPSAKRGGTPTLGIGYRISTVAGRMAIDMVWAEIALAALAGMTFYGLVTLAERATTFWHPSYRT